MVARKTVPPVAVLINLRSVKTLYIYLTLGSSQRECFPQYAQGGYP